MKYFFKIKLIIVLINFTFNSYSQNYLSYIPAYMDIGVTSSMADSLRNEGVETFFLWLTTISKNQISKNFDIKDSTEVTYFIWSQKGITKVALITDSCIYSSSMVISDTIFKFPKLNKIWLEKDENIFQFICPINFPNEKEIVVYIKQKSKLFFEIGANSSYNLDPSKNTNRNEFIFLLKKSLSSSNFNWVKTSDYNRWLDFLEQR